MILARDRNGRRIYETDTELAAALGVANIYEVAQFEDKVRTDSSGKKHKLHAICVNMADYGYGASKGGDARQGKNALRLAPGLEGQKHIRPHQQPQLVLRVLFLQAGQGVGGVAVSLPPDLQVQDLDPVFQAGLFHGQAGHFQPLLRSRAAGGQSFMRRVPRGDYQQFVQLQKPGYRPGGGNMSQVRRVERAAIYADPQS